MSSTIGRSRFPFLLKLAITGLFLATAASLIRADELQDAPQRKQQTGKALPGVFKAQITPHWFADNKRFWYRNDLRGGTKEFILVDAEAGKRTQAFDHAKLAAALSKADGNEYKADLLPFDQIDFVDANQAINFTVGKTAWKCDLSTYECTKTQASPTSRDEELKRGLAPFFANLQIACNGEQDIAKNGACPLFRSRSQSPFSPRKVTSNAKSIDCRADQG